MFRQYPIGCRFYFMGVEIFVFRHSRADEDFPNGSIQCTHLNKNGEFKRIDFWPEVLKTLG